MPFFKFLFPTDWITENHSDETYLSLYDDSDFDEEEEDEEFAIAYIDLGELHRRQEEKQERRQWRNRLLLLRIRREETQTPRR